MKMALLVVFSIIWAHPNPVSAQEQDSEGGFAVPYTERFVPGQALTISIPADPESFMAGGYPIDMNGYADLPIVGKIFVTDKTRPVMEAYLGEQLAPYLRDTHLQVRPAYRLTLVGFWKEPGMHYVSPDQPVWEAIKVTGGPAGERTLHNLRVMRGSERIDINLLDQYSRAQTLREAGVESGDFFVLPVPVPRTTWDYFREGVEMVGRLATTVLAVVGAYNVIRR